MSFRIKINTLLIPILLMGMTFVLAVNAASAHTPNDTYWSSQWGPGNISAPQAWDIQKGSTNVTIAILDTGINYSHEDLAGRVIQGWNFVNNSSVVMDDNSGSHGTHVSGIAAAIMDNSKGIAGIAQSRLLAVKVCNFMGNCTWNSIKDGIYYAANNSAKVISMSINKDDYYPPAEDAANYAYKIKGALLVACAGEAYIGNGTEFIAYPGNFSNVTAVGATDSNNQLAYFSNYGAKLELVAPGVDIYSTTNNGYGYNSGCSMSVPHVSGVAALVWSQNPALSNNEVRQILTSTADDLGSPGRDIYYGYGKVNAYGAVYLPGWSSRKQKTINGTTAGAQTNYQMNLTVYKGNGTDSPGNVYLGGNVRDDFGDIRFTKSDGVTLLDYWIESYTSGANATVWVEVDYIPASPSITSIYLYYGNPSATSASSGENTFIFYQDFDNETTGVDASGWIPSNSAYADTDIAAGVYYGLSGKSVSVKGNVAGNWHIYKATTYSGTIVLSARMRPIQTSGALGFGSWEGMSPTLQFGPAARPGGNTGRWAYYDTSWHEVEAYTVDTWYLMEIYLNTANGAYSVYKDGSLKGSGTGTTGGRTGLRSWADPMAGGGYIDNVLVRKYADPKPTWG